MGGLGKGCRMDERLEEVLISDKGLKPFRGQGNLKQAPASDIKFEKVTKSRKALVHREEGWCRHCRVFMGPRNLGRVNRTVFRWDDFLPSTERRVEVSRGKHSRGYVQRTKRPFDMPPCCVDEHQVHISKDGEGDCVGVLTEERRTRF